MNAKQRQRERILQHGLELKRAFFADPYEGIGPVTLCKVLHRLEVKATRISEGYCNGTATEADMEIEATGWVSEETDDALEAIELTLTPQEINKRLS